MSSHPSAHPAGLAEVLAAMRKMKRRLRRRVDRIIRGEWGKDSFSAAMQTIPLMLGEKTYNASHPDYDPWAVRNHPGTIFNAASPCANAVFRKIRAMAGGGKLAHRNWSAPQKEALAEARTVPGAEQVFERIAYIENYMAAQEARFGAYYKPGWVNMDDALFLYWLVRHLNPKTVVQTGVSNGLSSAFMMLALAKNGPDGQLYAIDLPAIFDPNNSDWTARGVVYGVAIPEGQKSGWIVPDMYYGSRFHVELGDAKDLLPPLIARLPEIDMFYHDSDHSYSHMMFEFAEAKKKLTPGGLIIGDDISWNASVWDFADQYGAPSYNYHGTVGVAFF